MCVDTTFKDCPRTVAMTFIHLFPYVGCWPSWEAGGILGVSCIVLLATSSSRENVKPLLVALLGHRICTG